MNTCKDCTSEIVCKYNDGVNEWSKGNCPHFTNMTKLLQDLEIVKQKLNMAIADMEHKCLYCAHFSGGNCSVKTCCWKWKGEVV